VLERDTQALALQQDLARRAAALDERRFPQASALLVREGEGGLRVAGDNTAGAALLSLLGTRNLAAFSGYRSYSVEALLAENPDILVIAAPDAAEPDDWLARYPLLGHLQAAKQNRAVMVPASSLVGGLSLATVEAAETLLQNLSATPALAGAGRP
jgi:ABC-type hemin transport system substrate-binding protein